MEARRQAYWAALQRADTATALRVVKELHLSGVPSWQIIEELVCPAQEHVGALWQAGTWTFSREHTITAINESAVRWLVDQAAPPVHGGPVLLVACIDAEEHALAALVVAEAVLSAGHPVRHLPGSTSTRDLLDAVGQLEPRAVLLSATLTSSLASHRPVLSALRALGVPVLVGGNAWGDGQVRAQRLGATAYAGNAREALAVLDGLPWRLEAQQPPPPSPAEVAADHLLTHRLVITADVASRLLRQLQGGTDRLPAWWPDLDSQLHHLVGCLAAAVVTDDPTIMVEARAWLAALIEARPGARPVVAPLWDLLRQTLLEDCPLAVRHLDAAGDAARDAAGNGA